MIDVVVTPVEVVVVEQTQAVDVSVPSTPSSYWEYCAVFNYLTGNVTTINHNEANYIPITWSAIPVSSLETGANWFNFVAQHTYQFAEFEVFFFGNENQGAPPEVINYPTASDLTIDIVFNGEVVYWLKILIRVPKNATGSFS